MSAVKQYWKESPLMVILFILIIAGITFAALHSLIVMEGRWATEEELGYAYIIPFIVGYFIWQNKQDLDQTEFSFSWLGFASLLFGLFLIMLGILSATNSIIQYGYVFSFIATFFMFLGFPAIKLIIAPLLLLFLIVPLPNFLLNNLSAELQLISSQIGVWVIRLFGISVYLEGNVIDLGKFQLQVAQACSGLRYLFPLISLSLIAAFLYRAAWWKRAVVVASSIPITVFMNSFRIGVIGVLVEYYGIEQAEGFLHQFEGWFVFMACVGLLILEMWLLVSFGPNKQKLSEVFAVELPVPLPKDVKFEKRPVCWKHFFTTIVVIAIAFYIGMLNQRVEIKPERHAFASYPLKVGDWQGHRGSIKKIYLDQLKLSDYIMADYTNPAGDDINFYMAYYNSQRSGAAVHSPRSCIPGGGWRIKSHTTVNIKMDKGSGKFVSVNRLLIQRGDYAQLVYYWFDQRGRDITNEYKVKWYLFWDSLNMNRTDGALVRLTTTLEPGEDVAKADKQLTGFLRLIQPTLHNYIPE